MKKLLILALATVISFGGISYAVAEQQDDGTELPPPFQGEDKENLPPGQRKKLVDNEDEDVPPGLRDKDGLPPGIQKRFGDRIEEEVKDLELISGEVVAVDEDDNYIDLSAGESYFYLKVSEDFVDELEEGYVYKQDEDEEKIEELADLKDLYIEVAVDEDYVVSEMKDLEEKEDDDDEKTEKFKFGFISDVNDDEIDLFVKETGEEKTFDLDDDVAVYGEAEEKDELEEGQFIEMSVLENDESLILYIYVFDEEDIGDYVVVYFDEDDKELLVEDIEENEYNLYSSSEEMVVVLEDESLTHEEFEEEMMDIRLRDEELEIEHLYKEAGKVIGVKLVEID
ncbi:hypothetical protein [Natranaerobius thermophilus]|uniref:Uncharacterized protein n=1 Tax=Natranaerobius thermophilus (strain ATCC BAA-1301 / DSM 18059 / JW/NM-WN-LF) TaxID=457570 RepID=B2A763_NATTJ|nr:hypothetical protein [Natranaerobius thermophilus]ACB84257.1 hypothetical protein Nther_0663 [Natranaerobius thermophilus JW/NM-WN-LF]